MLEPSNARERETKKSALTSNIESFSREWAPENKYRADRFHAELIMLITSLGDYMQEPMNQTLVSLLQTIARPPVFILGEGPKSDGS